MSGALIILPSTIFFEIPSGRTWAQPGTDCYDNCLSRDARVVLAEKQALRDVNLHIRCRDAVTNE